MHSFRSTGRRKLWIEALEERRLLATLPAGFSETVVAADLTSPITMDIEENGRIWLAYQDGRIEVIENDALLPTPAIHLDTDGSGERGLQGIELDPDFQNNGYIYVYYTAASPASHNRVSRLTVDPTTENTIIAGSELILLELPDLSTINNPIWHMGGAIHFMPDGTLAVQVGDHQGGVVAQDMELPFGKVLRVNPTDGSAASDNPFYSAGDGITWRDYIWSSGLRNPFSGDIDPATGRYFIGDVGQGTWEEINDATLPGRNFGWPTTEGNFNPATHPNFTNPFYAYSHAGGQCAITGGAFYSPATAQFPAEYQGKFFFSEFCGGDIWVIDPDNPADVEVFASDTPFPMNIEFAADGSMYYVERGAGAGGNPGIGTGKIIKVQFAAEIAPQLVTQPSDTLFSVGYDASFTVSVAGTPPIAYQWQRHNGTAFVNVVGATSATLNIPAVALADDGGQFRVIVSNSFGSTTSDVALLDVTADTPPTPVIDLPGAGATYRAGDTVQFSGHALDLEDGMLPGASLTWQVDFHHATHLHPFMPPTTGITSGEFTIPANSETAHDVWYRVRLIATDSAGLTTETFRDILSEKSDFVVTNNLGGGDILVDGQTKQAPHAVTGVVNVERSIEVPASQQVGSALGFFEQWIDGVTTRERTISTPEDDTAYVALYRGVSGMPVYLSDMPFMETPINGWGPIELDMSNGETAVGDGNPITLNGVVYAKGLGAHAYSEVVYNLAGGFSRFVSDVGVDDENAPGGSVVFHVFGDDVELFNSDLMTNASTTQTVNVDVTGVSVLKLVVTNGGDGDGSDHADWADARLFSAGGESLVNINFQAAGAAIPTDYLPDVGTVFGDRGNGWEYGWSSDHTDLGRDREINADQRLDTLVHFHAGQNWEIALPDGDYLVTASVGDAGNPSTHTLNVEGTSYWNGLPLEPNQFSTQTQLVSVDDGRLTLDVGDAADKSTRINYVQIVSAGAENGLLPLVSADVTLSGKLSYADVLAFGEGWGTHAPDATLEDLVRGGDLNFDGTTDAADWDLFNMAWNSAGMPTLSMAAVINPIAGDYDRSGTVNGDDYGLWKSLFGSTSELAADGNDDGVVDAADYTVWRDNNGAEMAAPSNAAAASLLHESPAIREQPLSTPIATALNQVQFDLAFDIDRGDSFEMQPTSRAMTRSTIGGVSVGADDLLILATADRATGQGNEVKSARLAALDEALEEFDPIEMAVNGREAWRDLKELMRFATLS